MARRGVRLTIAALHSPFPAQVAARLRLGDVVDSTAMERDDGVQALTGRGGRWKRRARAGKAATTSRKKVTATVRRRMAHSEDQVRAAGAPWRWCRPAPLVRLAFAC
jgi:hypothetical protein